MQARLYIKGQPNDALVPQKPVNTLGSTAVSYHLIHKGKIIWKVLGLNPGPRALRVTTLTTRPGPLRQAQRYLSGAFALTYFLSSKITTRPANQG